MLTPAAAEEDSDVDVGSTGEEEEGEGGACACAAAAAVEEDEEAKESEGSPQPPLVAAPPRVELRSEYDDTDTSSLFSLVKSDSSTRDLIMYVEISSTTTDPRLLHLVRGRL